MTVMIVICAVIGYLIGSVSVAVLLCRFLKHEDVREKGSHNAGSTNVARVYGLKIGLLVFVGDFAKMAIAIGIGWLLLGKTGQAAASIGCLIGHCWPIFFGFKGGKGVAVSAAIACFIDWRMLICLLIIFALAAVISKRVSVGSLAAALLYTPAMVLLGNTFIWFIITGIVVCLVVVLQHIPNIKRLINHTEAEFKPFKPDK